MFLGVAAFIYVHRRRRYANAPRYDRSILGEIDATLEQLRYQERALRYFAWWYLLPLAIPATLNMLTAPDPVPLWKWLYVQGSFLVGFLMIRSSLVRGLQPKIRRMEDLREEIGA